MRTLAVAAFIGRIPLFMGEDLAPGNSMAEAYSWLGMAVFLGSAAGSVLAEVLVEPWGWKVGVAVFAVTAVLGTSLALVRKTTIQKMQRPQWVSGKYAVEKINGAFADPALARELDDLLPQTTDGIKQNDH